MTLKALIPKESDFELQTLGEHIKRRRLQLGIHQKDAAHIFRVDTNTILNWEKGYTTPENHQTPTLIKFLGYDFEPPCPASIPEHLKAYRREFGLSHRQAAKRIGVDPSTWLRWEHGGTIMALEHRKLIANLLKLPKDEVAYEMKRQWNHRHHKPTVT